ncbi:MAG: TRAP transporter large permease subunit [Helicobacteraceae bacterium]|jgi:tripartite ATP-independent transporter DctM subunit|nr:TRAP transporter large permease subunit [Helicobacteraceae bacterium]
MIALIMFLSALLLLLVGFPVAFTFGGVAIIFAIISEGFMGAIDLFTMMPYRIMSTMTNTILMAIPLFIFMGIVLQKSKMAEKLLESSGILFGSVRGGLAVSTILIGALLAASTGVVGASVVAMGVIALPVMLKHKYDPKLASGVICASGTLGQIIPPSIVLIILADVMFVPVGDLFKAAVIPGLVLVGLYIVYVLVLAYFKKDVAPAIDMDQITGSRTEQWITALKAIVPPLVLMVLVLGSIFTGFATATESAAIGGIGAIILSFIYREFSWGMLHQSALETVKITSMVFAILIAATAFSMVFSDMGGDVIVEDFMMSLPGEKWGFLALSMIAILFLGFFIDFVEISFIVVPILAPIAANLGIDPIWFAILIAMNLQTSFLTPPFGFSLFYLKGVAPSSVTTAHIYKGVIPFIMIQVLVLAAIIVFPEFFGFNG